MLVKPVAERAKSTPKAGVRGRNPSGFRVWGLDPLGVILGQNGESSGKHNGR